MLRDQLERRAGELAAAYREVRLQTERLCAPLATEDYVAQSMPDASPAKWHLGHTSWFFETFVLEAALPGYQHVQPAYRRIFNSYYHSVGERHSRPERGLLTRPTVAQVYQYRAHVDRCVLGLLLDGPAQGWPVPVPLDVIEVGLHHEQQHQELLLTDVLHLFWKNPLLPAYAELPRAPAAGVPGGADPAAARSRGFREFPEGVREIGHEGPGFSFDNEGPRHRVLVQGFGLGRGLVTCGEYQAFIADGGYDRSELWLSDGWDAAQREGWRAPLYWEQEDGVWRRFSLHGVVAVLPDEPACHLSFYEADAYARWAGARLPTEQEWEVAAAAAPIAGSFLESGRLHPAPLAGGDAGPPAQLFGEAWQWTQSAYAPYPGYRPLSGALGEYNGKFMCNQLVLRGGSCGTPRGHIRASYRNFFPPAARWQFSGLRLARDL